MTSLQFSYGASFSLVKLMGPPSDHRVEYLVEGHLRSLDGLPSSGYTFPDHDLSHGRRTPRDLVVAFATLVTTGHQATINHEDRGVKNLPRRTKCTINRVSEFPYLGNLNPVLKFVLHIVPIVRHSTGC